MKAAARAKVCRRLALLAVLALATACGTGSPRLERPTDSSLAVAGFSNPRNTWELLAGYLPERSAPVDERVINELDLVLGEALREEGLAFVSEPTVGQCQDVVSREPGERPRMAALRHWLKVGGCVPTDYLLVPQILYWQERAGGKWGTDAPASVVMDFFLLDVRNEAILGRYKFEETQQPLSANLLDVDKFVSRGGKWVSAQELAREGIEEAIKELGL